MKKNSNAIRISGKFEIPLDTQLEKDTDYLVALEGSITGLDERSNQDGTYSTTWVYKPLKGQLAGKKGVSVPLTDKGGMSFRQRVMITKEFGMNYDEVMQKLLSNPERFRSFLEETIL